MSILDTRKEVCDIWNNLKDKTKMIDYLVEAKERIKELEKELEVYKKALELAVKKVAEYSGDYWQESKDYINQTQEELEEENE